MTEETRNADEGQWTPLLNILDDIRNNEQPRELTDDEVIVNWILREAELRGVREDDDEPDDDDTLIDILSDLYGDE